MGQFFSRSTRVLLVKIISKHSPVVEVVHTLMTVFRAGPQ